MGILIILTLSLSGDLFSRCSQKLNGTMQCPWTQTSTYKFVSKSC